MAQLVIYLKLLAFSAFVTLKKRPMYHFLNLFRYFILSPVRAWASWIPTPCPVPRLCEPHNLWRFAFCKYINISVLVANMSLSFTPLIRRLFVTSRYTLCMKGINKNKKAQNPYDYFRNPHNYMGNCFCVYISKAE